VTLAESLQGKLLRAAYWIRCLIIDAIMHAQQPRKRGRTKRNSISGEIKMNKGRRTFIQGAAIVGAGLAAVREASGVPRQRMDDMQDMKNMPGMKMKGKKETAHDYGPFVPVETPDVPNLPFRMDGNIKEFHLIAEPVKQEIVPGRIVDLWEIPVEMDGAPGFACAAYNLVRMRNLMRSVVPT
jgi:hypothetical protein